MDEKRRRDFKVSDIDGVEFANGILYDEGNIQVLWRTDIGYCAEQYSSLIYAFDLFEEAKTVQILS